MSAPEIRVLETEAELAGIAGRWWELWRRAPDATPFQSPAWLLPWWRAFEPGRLHTIAVLEGSELLGLAPLYVEQGSGKLLPVGISLSDYTDILIGAEQSQAARQAIAAALSSTRAPWHTWLMPELPAASQTAPVAGLISGEIMRGAAASCPVLPIDGADGLRHVPARKRRKLRMAGHRVVRAGAGRIVDQSALQGAAWWGHLTRLHAARWWARGEGGVLAGAAVQRFQREALQAMLSSGIARLHALVLGQQVAGIYYGFVHRKRAYAYIGGFDPEAAYCSPGTVLIGAAIEAAHREGARELHFLRGGEPYKYEWGAVDRCNEWLQLRRAG